LLEKWKADIEATPARMLRHLSGRLYSADPDVKWRAVRALGALAADAALLTDERLAEQLRRYLWALNDESGAVPFGVAEAIGEILARRPSLQEAFLPLLCSMTAEEEVSQTGPIERGVIWAIGRVGASALICDPDVLPRIRSLAESHPDQETRQVASWALRRLEGGAG
jgi:hypothetical protein